MNVILKEKRVRLYPVIHDVEYKLNIVYRRDDSNKLCLTISLKPKFKLDGFPRFYYINNSRIRELSIQKSAGTPIRLAGQSILEAKARVIKELIKA
jgi:hypothetical protein